MMPEQREDLMKVLAPFVKGADGRTLIVLSDSSVDRQGERIAPELIKRWATVDALPALVDHRHSIDSIVAVWKNLRAVEMGGHVALVAEPDWLDDDYSQKVRKKVEQLVKKGLRVGVSIGAVPKESRFDEKGVREWVDAELVEASFVAIPANRNAGVWQASYDAAEVIVKSLYGAEGDAAVETKASPTAVALVADAMKELKALKEYVNNAVDDETVREGVATIVNRILKELAVVRDRLLGKAEEGDNMVEKAVSKVTVTRRPWTAPLQSQRKKLPAWVFLDPENKKYPVFEWKHLLNGGKERILNCNAVRVAIAYSAKYGDRTVYNKAKNLWQRYCARKSKKEIDVELAKDEVPTEEVDDYVEDFVCPDCGEFEDYEAEWDESILAQEAGDIPKDEEVEAEVQPEENVEEKVEEPKEEAEPVEEAEAPAEAEAPEQKSASVDIAKLAEVIEQIRDRLEKLEARLGAEKDEPSADADEEEGDAQKAVVPVVEKSDAHRLIVYKPVKVR